MYWLSILSVSLLLVSVFSAPTYFDKSASAQKAPCLGSMCTDLVEIIINTVMRNDEGWNLPELCDVMKQICSSQEQSCIEIEDWKIQVVNLACDAVIKDSTSTISPMTSQEPVPTFTEASTTTSSPQDPVPTPTIGSIFLSDISELSSISGAETSTDSSTSTFEQFTAPMIGGPIDVEPSSPVVPTSSSTSEPASTEPAVSTPSTSSEPQDSAVELSTSVPKSSIEPTEPSTLEPSTSESAAPNDSSSTKFDPSEGVAHTHPETPETSSTEPEASTTSTEPTTFGPSASEPNHPANLETSSSEPGPSPPITEPATFEPTATFTSATFTSPPPVNPETSSTEPEASTDPIEPTTLEPSTSEPDVSSSSTFEPSTADPFDFPLWTDKTSTTEPEPPTDFTEPNTLKPSTSGPDVSTDSSSSTFEPSATTPPFTWLPPWPMDTSSTEPGSSTASTEPTTFEPSTPVPDVTTGLSTFETDSTFIPITTETQPPFTTQPTDWTTPTTPPSTLDLSHKVLTTDCQKRLLESGSSAEDTIIRAFQFVELNVDRKFRCLILNGLYSQHAVNSVREVCGQSDAEFVELLWNFLRHAYRCHEFATSPLF
ncbi:unnamed protein product [Caenorhabditis nigoni]